MRVLQLFGGVIRRGGEEMFVLNCMRHFDDDEVDFDVLVVEDCGNDEFRSFVEGRGGSLYELNIPLHATRFMNHIYKPVLEFLREHRYDAVHIHSSSISALAVISAAARKAGAPKIIVHSHATGSADSLEHKLFRSAASLPMSRNVDVYCACSSAAAEWKFAPRYASRAVIVRNGIDTGRFRFSSSTRAELRAELEIPEHTFVIGHVGRLCGLKNQAFLIRVAKLLSDRGEDFRLLLVGGGEDEDELRGLARELGLKDKVILTGDVKIVQDYLCAMDAFAFPSDREGLGIVAVEAQCSGLPVVASTGVPGEVRLTEDVVFLDVGYSDEAYAAWADALMKFRGRVRPDNTEVIRSAGYDISYTVGQLREIYGIK